MAIVQGFCEKNACSIERLFPELSFERRRRPLFQHIQGSKMFTYGARCVCIKMKTATVFNEKCFSEN